MAKHLSVFHLLFCTIILIGRIAFDIFVKMFFGILPSNATREGRLDYHGGSSCETCKVLVFCFVFCFGNFYLFINFFNIYISMFVPYTEVSLGTLFRLHR